MSSRFIRIRIPLPVHEPRGARWVGALATLAGDLGRACARGLRPGGSPRPSAGDQDLLALATRVEREMPTLAVELRAIAGHQARAV